MEKVLFARDEMANISWAIEQAVEGPLGNCIQRAERETKATREASSAASKSAQRAYRLAVEPPSHWFPFSVKNIGDALSPQNVFQLKLRAGCERQPWGRILNPYTQPGMQIPEEEIPREGVIVTRAYDYTRWTDGSTHLWMGRRKQTGKGEGASNLKFDFLE